MYKLLFLLVVLTASFSHQALSAQLTIPIEHGSSATLLLPVPNNTIPENADITVNTDQGPVKADIYYRLLWPNSDQKEFVRLLVLNLSASFSFSELTLSWRDGKNAIRPYWGSLGDVTLISPSLEWLQRVVKLHALPATDQSWYTNALRGHGNYIADVQQMAAHNYPVTRAAQWLYDKPQSFFQLYLLTGDDWALRQAKGLSTFYARQVKDDGYFGLSKRDDIKYIISRGLLYHFLFTGSEFVKDTVAKQFEASLDWNETYHSGRGFWTERNQAAALNTALAHWELTGKAEAKQRIDDIIGATYAMTFAPANDWQQRDCPQHTMQSHEGSGGDRPVCSPWMMALLADGLWRTLLLSGDSRAAELLRAFGRFFSDYGAYVVDRRGEKVTAPYYLRAFPDTRLIEKNAWNDTQHICEIAGMLGKSILAYDEPKSAPDKVVNSFKEFSALCRQKLSNVAEKYLKKGQGTAIRIKPPRRFGWTYSSTGELPWMMQTIIPNTE